MEVNNNQAVLELNNIHKSFGKNHIHRGISFKLYKGECLALLGGSGQGKSVLLRSIIGLEKADDGEIKYLDKNLRVLTEDALLPIRTNISYSFQNGALFDSSTVFENLSYPLYEHTQMGHNEIKDKVSEYLDLIEMPGTEELMPSDLSGGMQKRVGMARSMILGPEIVLYDEPTAGLDPVNTKNVVNIIKKFKKLGNSSIFVTHDIASALELCDRFVILDKGVIIFDDESSKFMNSTDQRVKKFLMNL